MKIHTNIYIYRAVWQSRSESLIGLEYLLARGVSETRHSTGTRGYAIPAIFLQSSRLPSLSSNDYCNSCVFFCALVLSSVERAHYAAGSEYESEPSPREGIFFA